MILIDSYTDIHPGTARLCCSLDQMLDGDSGAGAMKFFFATPVVECEELQPSASRTKKEDRHDDRAELLNKSKHRSMQTSNSQLIQ